MKILKSAPGLLVLAWLFNLLTLVLTQAAAGSFY